MMTHERVIAGDVVEKYLAGTLTPEERDLFEAHYFECDECFATVQAADALRTSVRDLAQRGQLPEAPVNVAPVKNAAPAMRPVAYAPWLALAATIAIAAASTVSQQRRSGELQAELDGLRDRHAQLQQSLDRATATLSAQPTAPAVVPEGNVPLAILQVSRSASAPVAITIPATASRFVVWLDSAPVPPGTSAQLILQRTDGSSVATVGDLRVNDQEAIVASFPADGISSGSYTLRLLAGERERASFRLLVTATR